MNRIGIIAALSGELKPFIRDWQKKGHNVWTGQFAGCQAVAIAGGMGMAFAARAAERACEEFGANVLVSYGWAGALTCAVKPPAGCVISEVVDTASGERFATANADGYRLITLDHVAQLEEKHGLAQVYQSVLVDMEAAAVAQVAVKRGAAFYCFKGVSDAYTDRLPDFNRFMRANGGMRMGAFVAYALMHPQYWSTLARLAKNSSAAAKSLVDLATEGLKHLQEYDATMRDSQ